MGDSKILQLHELEELMNQACENAKIYKEQKNGMIERLKKGNFGKDNWFGPWKDSRLKLFPGKLKYRWFGLFTVHKVFPHGPVELKNNISGDSFKVYEQRLKPYHQGQKSGMVEEA